MDAKKFESAAPGRLIRVGLPGADFSFVPDPLPAQWTWPESLWPLLLQANTALARLDGIGAYLPDPELLLRPLQNREAQTSSRLEGTFARPEQVLLFELEPPEAESGSDAANAPREVFNYARALRYPNEAGSGLPLSLRLIRKLHEILLEGVRGQDRTPGEFRRQLVQIGKPARFVPPPPNELMLCLDAFEKYLHQEHRLDPLVEAFVAHYQFETIHPFLDGNGRVGRLLLSLSVAQWCRLSKPWLHMSAYFERNKDRYFDLLFRVSAANDWTSWIQFCLEGVAQECNEAATRCRRLLELKDRFHSIVRGAKGSTRLVGIVDDLFRVPLVTVAGLAKAVGVTYPTSKADIRKLVELRILRELREAPRKTFFAPELVDVIYGEMADRSEPRR